MWDLRWVLLGLGALVLVGIYLWSRGIVSRDMLPTLPRRKERMEPVIGESPPLPSQPEPESLVETVSEEEKAKPAPDRIVALRLIPRGGELRQSTGSWSATGPHLRTARVCWVPVLEVYGPSGRLSSIVAPLWIPLVLCAGVTGWLFWRDRPSRRPGACRQQPHLIAVPYRSDRTNNCGTFLRIAGDKVMNDTGADVESVEDDIGDQHKSYDHEPC